MKLLVIEDDRCLMDNIVQYSNLERFSCDTTSSYEEGIWKIKVFQYNCIILNTTLAGDSWPLLFDFLRKNQRRDGVIIISDRGTSGDKIYGLNVGADDYLAKPFALSELNARVKALIRRRYAQGSNLMKVGPIKVDLQWRTVICEDLPIHLSKYEYNLLLLLMTNQNRTVTFQAIAEHIANGSSDQLFSLNTIYSHVKNLKKKLKEKGCREIIHSIYGLGYRLVP